LYRQRKDFCGLTLGIERRLRSFSGTCRETSLGSPSNFSETSAVAFLIPFCQDCIFSRGDPRKNLVQADVELDMRRSRATNRKHEVFFVSLEAKWILLGGRFWGIFLIQKLKHLVSQVIACKNLIQLHAKTSPKGYLISHRLKKICRLFLNVI
jgi:hypothetical protein